MEEQKGISTLIGIIIIVFVAVILFGGIFVWQYFVEKNNPTAGPALSGVEGWKTYTNTQYGFELTFPDSWKGYTVEESSWQGWTIDGSSKKYSGSELVFTNPQGPNNHTGNIQSCWQNIPIMVIAPDNWLLIAQEKVAVSAAPVGPAKIGQNANYVFATPPRWSGFVCDLGIQEAYDIVKTLKVIK